MMVKIFIPKLRDGGLYNKEEYIDALIKNIHDSNVGFAGFFKKKYLKNFLNNEIFDRQSKEYIKHINIPSKRTKDIIIKTLKKCEKHIPAQSIKVFIFPSYNSFINLKMGGTSGFTPYKNTFIIFINSLNKKWQSNLRVTTAHEFCHSQHLLYQRWETLLDSLIFEGLAENFSEKITKIRTPWSHSTTFIRSKKIFSLIKDNLPSKSQRAYYELFLENKKYKIWTGYSVGYWILKSFLKSNKECSWKDIFKLTPQEILNLSNYLKNPK